MIDLNKYPKLPKYLQDADYWGEWEFLNYPGLEDATFEYAISTKGYFINLSSQHPMQIKGPTVSIPIVRSIFGVKEFVHMKSPKERLRVNRAHAMLRAFVGPPGEFRRAVFIDGDKHNYDVSNLRWK